MNQLNLFATTGEKGTNEWDIGRAVREDSVGMFRVASPQRPETPRYTNVIPIVRLNRVRPMYFKNA